MARFEFPEWTESFKKWVLLLAAGAPVYLLALWAYGLRPEAIRIGYQPKQPVPYSHALHVGELGLDCRYCHTTVERAAHAAVPPAQFCMNCHATIRTDSAALQPVRDSFASGAPIKWNRVHDLPDYVFFNHSAHVTRGVGCEECHGRIDLMEQVYQHAPLTMEWCLNCHRDPAPHLRPRELVTVMGYDPPGDRRELGRRLADNNKIAPPTNCSTCHR
ncbi:MAG TPA: cytochrome c3 family protein [Kofleriaceae bacterium]|nr:cytochrome c3 family protein [Kofleriaceae bacterium]